MLLSHLASVGGILQKLIQVSTITRLEIIGNLNLETEKTLASFRARRFKYWKGPDR